MSADANEQPTRYGREDHARPARSRAFEPSIASAQREVQCPMLDEITVEKRRAPVRAWPRPSHVVHRRPAEGLKKKLLMYGWLRFGRSAGSSWCRSTSNADEERSRPEPSRKAPSSPRPAISSPTAAIGPP